MAEARSVHRRPGARSVHRRPGAAGLDRVTRADGVAECQSNRGARNELGLAALIFLIASLACTPARRAFGWTWPPRIRRELGLFAFAYAMLHVSVYVLLTRMC